MHKKDMAAKIIKEMHNIVGQQNCVFTVFEKCTIITVRNALYAKEMSELTASKSTSRSARELDMSRKTRE